jgi:hypothetical protein
VPEAEAGDGAYLILDDNNQPATTAASFKQGHVDIEAGLAPRPPSAPQKDSTPSRQASARVQTVSLGAAGRASFSAMAPLPASPSLHTASSPFSGYAAQPLADPDPPPPPKKASWVVRSVSLTHKYTDPTEVDITITNAGGRVAGWNVKKAFGCICRVHLLCLGMRVGQK